MLFDKKKSKASVPAKPSSGADSRSSGSKTGKDRLTILKEHSMIFAIVGIILGVILLIWPRATMELVCIFIGVALLIYGGISILHYFVVKKDPSERSLPMLILGIILAIIGLCIALRPTWLIALIPTIVGIIVIIAGIISLSAVLAIKKEHDTSWKISVALSIIAIILGLILVIRPLSVASFIIRLMGIVLIYAGASAIFTSRTTKTDLDYLKKLKDVKDLDKEK